MAKKRKPSKRPGGGASQPSGSSSIGLTQVPGSKAWALVHPRAARDRAEDLEEVRAMIEGGELEVAADELRWLLSGCTDCIEAHLLLGDLALEMNNDVPLARGHYGYAYQLGLKAWNRAGNPTPVPYSQPANRWFLEAGRGLAWCLEKLGKPDMANEVVSILLKLDPADPLEVRHLIDSLRTGGLPIVDLG